jgi:hypothetical protein
MRCHYTRQNASDKSPTQPNVSDLVGRIPRKRASSPIVACVYVKLALRPTHIISLTAHPQYGHQRVALLHHYLNYSLTHCHPF